MPLSATQDAAVAQYWAPRVREYAEQADALRRDIAAQAKVTVADMSKSLSDAVEATTMMDNARHADEDGRQLGSPNAAHAARRVQARIQRKANVREVAYAAGEAGAQSYWRDPVGSHRDGKLGGDVDRFADPYVLAREERLKDNPRWARVGDNTEDLFESSMAHLHRLEELKAEHESSGLRTLEVENRIREELNHRGANGAGQAFLRSVKRMPTRMSKHPLVLDRPDIKPNAWLTRKNQVALEALRHTGQGRQLRADYSSKKWAANIPATEYYGRIVSKDLREEMAFDEFEASQLLDVRAF